jgi:hypothetical protein
MFLVAMRKHRSWLKKLMDVFRRPFTGGKRRKKGQILWPC